MIIRMPRRMARAIILFVFLLVGALTRLHAASPAESNGTLIANITWGDVENTPAKGVYVEAYGYVASSRSKQSFVFKMSEAGRYEVSLPPGLYDVFISDDSSIPRCKRMRVTSGKVSEWLLKLEFDEANAHF